MISINAILDYDGEFNEGISVSPNWITKGKNDNNWEFHTTEIALKELRKIKRMKGTKTYSIALQFGDHLNDWIDVTYSILVDMVRNRSKKFRNCTINQLWYIKLHSFNDTIHRVSVWPATLINENENNGNNWGEEE